MKSSVDKRSVSIAGRSTSVSLEKLFWDCLQEIAEERGQSLRQLIASIDAERKEGNLSSAIRLFILGDYQHRTLKRPRRGARPVGDRRMRNIDRRR
jgi:predicted DNA-binding ribbon-helix-helix protein